MAPRIISPFTAPAPANASSAVVTYDAATTLWINAVVAAGGTVTDTQKGRVDALIVGLKADSLFTVLDRLWLYAGEADDAHSQQATIDIISRQSGIVVGHAPTLTAGGYTGNGSSQYVDTNFVPPSGNYALNTCSFGAYSITSSTTTNNNVLMGNQNTGTTALCDILPLTAANTATTRINQFGGDMANSTTDGNRKGFYCLTSADSTHQTLYKNGGSALGTGAVQRSVPSFSLYVLARNDSGAASSFASDQAAASFIGGALNATQQGNLSTRVNNYMSAWGIAVY